jgi:hypothetical protein
VDGKASWRYELKQPNHNRRNTMNFDITEKAMLASLQISQWSARKHDKRVSEEVDQRYNGNNAGRFNKMLATKESLKEIQAAVGAARTFHMEQTLPWGERGERLLPSKNYGQYSKTMRIYKQDFDQAVQAFVADYHSVIFEAKKTLGRFVLPGRLSGCIRD